MQYKEALCNVKRGLLEAPDYIVEAYQSNIKRSILESLIIDRDTPELVYIDLLGWDYKFMDEYCSYFFCVPKDISRLGLYEFIDTAPIQSDEEIKRKDLMMGVYEHGWSYIDSLFNKGKRVSIQEQTLINLRKIMGRLSLIVHKVLKDPTLGDLRDVIKVMKEAINVDALSKLTSDSVEALTFQFVEEMQQEANTAGIDRTKIMALEFDDLKRLVPAEMNLGIKDELDKIAADVKEIEDKAAEEDKKV